MSYAQDAPNCGIYTYAAETVRVIDGDTVVADIDLGFNTWLRNEHLRLSDIEAPERGADGHDAATEALRKRVDGKQVYVCTIKKKRSERERRGSFDRYLAVIYEDGANVNDWLFSEGYVKPYD